MNDESDSRMVRLPVREMSDEPAPQRAAQEGDLPPLLTDANIGVYISKELAEYADGAYADFGCAKDQLYRFARAIESEVRTAIAAAGGGVPQGSIPIDPVHWCIQWIRDNYQDHPTIDGLCAAMLASSPQPETAPAVAQVPQDVLNKCKKALLEYTQVPENYHAAVLRMRDALRDLLAAAPEAPAQLNPAYRIAPVDPTLEMIDAGAQRLVSWGENSTWPDSWDALQVEAARTEADRCYRSMILVAPGPEAPEQDTYICSEQEHNTIPCPNCQKLPEASAQTPHPERVTKEMWKNAAFVALELAQISAAALEAPAQAAQWNPPPLTCPRSNRSDCALFGASIRVNSAKGSDHG